MITELTVTAAQVTGAEDYTGVFGDCVGDPSKQARHIRHIFRRLAAVLHPDRYRQADEQTLATEAFARLQQLHTEARAALDEGVYGQPRTLVVVTSRRGKHELRRHLVTSDLCTLYTAHSVTAAGQSRPTICKIASRPGDQDLLEAEARAIKRLRASGTNELAHPYIPELVDSFAYREKGKPARRANVLNRLNGFYNLDQLRQHFPHGLNPLDAAWIWRRLLVALDHAHRNQVVHGAVLPAHVMVEPALHGVVLVDWCYASLAEDDTYPPVKAVVDAYRDWYPPEVLAKQPPSPATDLAMAVRCMTRLMGGDPVRGNLPPQVPKGLRAFFKGCLQTKQTARPQDAFELREEFDALLERLGPPYYPRRFRPLTLPTGMA